MSADSWYPPTRYDDRQLALILKIASTLQAELPARPESLGYTLEEVQQIADEAGISPEALWQAALTLEAEEVGAPGRILGAPTEFQFERGDLFRFFHVRARQ